MIHANFNEQRLPGCGVMVDEDHTEGSYAAEELLQGIFDEEGLITSRERVAEDAAIATRHTILRRIHEKKTCYVTLVERALRAVLRG